MNAGLFSRDFPASLDQRRAPVDRGVDIDPTCPMRRASDMRPQANQLAREVFKASQSRFDEDAVHSALGVFA